MSLTRQSAAMSTFTPSGAGATTQILATALEEMCHSVKAYGAKGDGATDDALAIQHAVNAAIAAGGGIVYLPPGKYLIGSTVTIAKVGVPGSLNELGITFLGAGRGATTLVRKASCSGPLVLVGGQGIGTQKGALVHNLSFVCPVDLVEDRDYTYSHLKFSNVQSCQASLLTFNEGPCDLHLWNAQQCEFSDIVSIRDYTPNDVAGMHAVIIQQSATAGQEGGTRSGDIFFRSCNFRIGGITTSAVTESTVLVTGCDGLWFDGCHLEGGYNIMLVAGNADTYVIGGVRCNNVWFDLLPGITTWANPASGKTVSWSKYKLAYHGGVLYRCVETHSVDPTTAWDATKWTAVPMNGALPPSNAPPSSGQVRINGATATIMHNFCFVGCVFMASQGYRYGVLIENGAKADVVTVQDCLFTDQLYEAIAILSVDHTLVRRVKIDNNLIEYAMRGNNGATDRPAIVVGGITSLTVIGNMLELPNDGDQPSNANCAIVVNAKTRGAMIYGNSWTLPGVQFGDHDNAIKVSNTDTEVWVGVNQRARLPVFADDLTASVGAGTSGKIEIGGLYRTPSGAVRQRFS